MRKRNEKDLGERKEISLSLQPLDIPWLVRKPPRRRELYLWYYPRSTLPPVPALGSSAQPLCCVGLVGEQMAMGGRRPAPGRGTQCWGLLGGRGEGGNSTREASIKVYVTTLSRERRWCEKMEANSCKRRNGDGRHIFARDTLHG